MISCRILCKNRFNLFFLFFCRKIKSFECPKSIRNYQKKILGTSDAWSTSPLSHRPSKPAYYIVDWRIFSWNYRATMTVFAVCYRSKKVWGIYPDSVARQNARAWAIKGHTKDDLFSSHPPPWNMPCRRSSLEKSF